MVCASYAGQRFARKTETGFRRLKAVIAKYARIWLLYRGPIVVMAHIYAPASPVERVSEKPLCVGFGLS